MPKPNVNIREIAKAAGVSIASVSRAFQQPPSPYLSETQRNRILEVCATLRYSPNEHTRRMFSRKADTVALFFPPFGRIKGPLNSSIDANFGSCMLGAQEVLASYGIDLLLTETSERFLETRRYLQMIRGKIVDGVLLWGVTEYNEYVHELLEENIPAAMLQTEKPGCDCPKVISDDFSAMRKLTERVIAAGHRRIAVLLPPQAGSVGRHRMRGILETLEANGIPPVYVSEEKGYDYEFGRQATARLLEQTRDVSCIMNPNDMTAWGCIEELQRQGFSVPGDISVTGADGINFPGPVKISSFSLPSYDIGRQGAELLYRMICGERKPDSVVLLPDEVPGNTLRSIGI